MGLFRRTQPPRIPERRTSRVADRREPRATSVESSGDTYSFRRNRTLTGSLASHVTSAGEATSELRSSRLQTHDLHRHRRHLFRTLMITFAGILGLSYVVYQFIATPKVVIIGVTTDTVSYQQGVQAYLNGHPFERLRSTINTSSLRDYLQQHDFPEVSGVSPDLQWNSLGMSTLTLTVRKPVVSWKTGTTLHYVDEQGNAFSRNYYAPPSVQVVDQTGLSGDSQKVMTSGRFLSFLGKIIGQMKIENLVVTQVVLPASTTHQVQVSVEGVAYPIKFSVDRVAGEQAEDAARAISYLSQKGITPEYLDVRVSGRAFYK